MDDRAVLEELIAGRARHRGPVELVVAVAGRVGTGLERLVDRQDLGGREPAAGVEFAGAHPVDIDARSAFRKLRPQDTVIDNGEPAFASALLLQLVAGRRARGGGPAQRVPAVAYARPLDRARHPGRRHDLHLDRVRPAGGQADGAAEDRLGITGREPVVVGAVGLAGDRMLERRAGIHQRPGGAAVGALLEAVARSECRGGPAHRVVARRRRVRLGAEFRGDRGDEHRDGGGVGGFAVADGVVEDIAAGKTRIGRVGERAVAVDRGGTVGRIVHRVNGERVAVGVAVVGEHIDGDRRARCGGRRIVNGVRRRVGRVRSGGGGAG